MSAADERIDEWWCEHCRRTWLVASRPHNPSCPRCGRSGWWKRFLSDQEVVERMGYGDRGR
jgi:hypothetical protein